MSHIKALDERIKYLEGLISEDRKMMREQFGELKESLSPANLLNNALREISESADLKNNVANYAISIGAGALSKKILSGSGKNPIRNLLGTLVQFGVSNLVSKKADTIKTVGGGLLSNLITAFSKRHKKNGEEEKREEFEYNTY